MHTRTHTHTLTHTHTHTQTHPQWVLVGGYLVNPSSIPAWLRWLRYASPLSYAFEVMAANEMGDQAYDLQLAHLALGYEHRCGQQPAETGLIVFEWPTDLSAAIDCGLLVFDEQDLEIGRKRREEAFSRIASCQARGLWPSHGRHPFRPASISFGLPEPTALDLESIDLF